ncbi:DNA-directed RNA polymerase subunit D [Aeropyrum pernix]|uniref:DNA-directed RNA polymerase subunit D n=1 Tax=Aeropyrum pernix TaxID=56636 RepID=UPI001F52174D|nr:DNA-directed RNA polymerase subunit D [Aeropyrum pernix]
MQVAETGDRSVEVVELDSLRVRLRIRGYPVVFVNAIRRTVLSDVPTMAVDYAYIFDNTTAVYDEMVAHRLGLVVLDSNEAVEKYRRPEECAGKEPSEEDCFVEVSLEAEVDAEGETGRYITAGDLSISDPQVKPVYPETPLIYVAPGQRIHVQAFARLGRGKEHTKWSPASLSVLRYTPILIYDSSKAGDECLECLSAYPQVVEALKSGGKGSLVLEGLRRTSGLRYCAETACRGAVEVRYDSSNLDLEVESTGALRPEKIVELAIRELEEKVKRFAEAVESVGVEES